MSNSNANLLQKWCADIADQRMELEAAPRLTLPLEIAEELNRSLQEGLFFEIAHAETHKHDGSLSCLALGISEIEEEETAGRIMLSTSPKYEEIEDLLQQDRLIKSVVGATNPELHKTLRTHLIALRVTDFSKIALENRDAPGAIIDFAASDAVNAAEILHEKSREWHDLCAKVIQKYTYIHAGLGPYFAAETLLKDHSKTDFDAANKRAYEQMLRYPSLLHFTQEYTQEALKKMTERGETSVEIVDLRRVASPKTGMRLLRGLCLGLHFANPGLLLEFMTFKNLIPSGPPSFQL